MSELFESLGRDNGFVFDLSKYLVIMAVSDAVLYLAVPSLRKARWKVLHAIANFMVTVLSLKDAYDTVIDPIESCKGWLFVVLRLCSCCILSFVCSEVCCRFSANSCVCFCHF